ncbi:hypothetical protein [Portibacter lacus]|uniref:Tetratricopeptide repeat protein n=1 Tax=Portibacter lacus TaxID=1099794 RepID=A0AA37SSY6_9BACT|nr:hypothetical protein [Portibacter lacus]GLR19778.1 hypothetical protein GCM10007940_43940 [Portibacter lacus]
MSAINSTYYADVVLGFKQIPEKNYSRQIYFIEKNREIVENMESDFRIDLLDKYNIALYEIGHFKKCLDHLDLLIFDVINENFQQGSDDLFCVLLKRKAFALFNIGEFEKAQHVSSELLKIDPTSLESNLILTNAGYKLIKQKTKGIRAVAVMMLIFGICFTCFDLLVIHSFYPEQIVKVGNIQLFTIGSAISIILCLEVFAFFKGRQKTIQIQKESLHKKRLRS